MYFSASKKGLEGHSLVVRDELFYIDRLIEKAKDRRRSVDELDSDYQGCLDTVISKLHKLRSSVEGRFVFLQETSDDVRRLAAHEQILFDEMNAVLSKLSIRV